MEYHENRFEDFSLIVFKNDKPIALLPANRVDETLHSHQGLSYGGLILKNDIKFNDVLSSFQALLQFLDSNGIHQLQIKAFPKIYHLSPSDELDYLLFILKAELQKKETLSALEQSKKIKFSRDRINGIRRGEKHQLKVKEVNEFDAFWNEILTQNLKKKHGAKPVHSLEEIQKLKLRFPKQIRQFNVYYKSKLVAGTTIFESKQVAHCQYISADEDKNTLGSLDFLHHHLITKVFKDKEFYDFGSSNEANGRHINEGLQYWKEGFGARTIIHEFFSLKTKNGYLLNDVMV